MDIEMLKYQQLSKSFQETGSASISEEPYKEEQEFFLLNSQIFDFENIEKALSKLGRNTVFTLSNGNRVEVVKANKTILITYGKKGGAKFTGSWTLINNYEDYVQTSEELNEIIERSQT